MVMNPEIANLLMGPYDRRVMNNVHRAHFVECLIAVVLGEEWELTWQQGWDWAAWDLESQSGIRLEVKQSALKQAWDRPSNTPRRAARFDIAPRQGYWTRDGSSWVDRPGRPADVYVFAWHGENESELCDQRDAEQWRFFVVQKQYLPIGQKTIVLTALEKLAEPCTVSELKTKVAAASSASGASKGSREEAT